MIDPLFLSFSCRQKL